MQRVVRQRGKWGRERRQRALSSESTLLTYMARKTQAAPLLSTLSKFDLAVWVCTIFAGDI